MLGFLVGYAVGHRRRRRYRWTLWHVLGVLLLLAVVVAYWYVAVPLIVATVVALGIWGTRRERRPPIA